jgi:hypothetical protein
MVQGRIGALQCSQEHTHRMITLSLALPTAALLHIGVYACII